MSNLFKTVRIIHSPIAKRYVIQSRRMWRFWWYTEDIIGYVDHVTPHQVLNKEAAYKLAQERAESLLAQVVVWAINPELLNLFKDYRQQVIKAKQRHVDEIYKLAVNSPNYKGRKLVKGYDPETMDGE